MTAEARAARAEHEPYLLTDVADNLFRERATGEARDAFKGIKGIPCMSFSDDQSPSAMQVYRWEFLGNAPVARLEPKPTARVDLLSSSPRFSLLAHKSSVSRPVVERLRRGWTPPVASKGVLTGGQNLVSPPPQLCVLRSALCSGPLSFQLA